MKISLHITYRGDRIDTRQLFLYENNPKNKEIEIEIAPLLDVRMDQVARNAMRKVQKYFTHLEQNLKQTNHLHQQPKGPTNPSKSGSNSPTTATQSTPAKPTSTRPRPRADESKSKSNHSSTTDSTPWSKTPNANSEKSLHN